MSEFICRVIWILLLNVFWFCCKNTKVLESISYIKHHRKLGNSRKNYSSFYFSREKLGILTEAPGCIFSPLCLCSHNLVFLELRESKIKRTWYHINSRHSVKQSTPVWALDRRGQVEVTRPVSWQVHVVVELSLLSGNLICLTMKNSFGGKYSHECLFL